MLNIDSAVPIIAHEFALATGRAMQCPAIDPLTGEWYVSQADNFPPIESMHITRNSADVPKHKKISVMRLVNGGHGSTITVLHRDGVLGIVTHAWGKLHWIRYREGDVKKDAADIIPIWSGTYAHIDHETSTVCLRSGSSFKLFALDGAKLGKQIGKTVTGLSNPGPGQGFCSGKIDGEFYVFAMWDYGRPTSKPSVVWGSVATGKRVGDRSARLFPKAKRNEPESGIVLNNVFHLGMSVVDSKKHGYLVQLAVGPVEPPPPPPPPVPVTIETYLPNLTHMPADAQAATQALAAEMSIDMFNPKSPKLWPNLTKGLKAADYWLAADNSGMKDRPVENRINKILYLQAARVTQFALDPSVINGAEVVVNSAVVNNADPTVINQDAWWTQTMLRELKLYTKKVDGLFGPLSRAAFAAYWADGVNLTNLQDLSGRTLKLVVV